MILDPTFKDRNNVDRTIYEIILSKRQFVMSSNEKFVDGPYEALRFLTFKFSDDIYTISLTNKIVKDIINIQTMGNMVLMDYIGSIEHQYEPFKSLPFISMWVLRAPQEFEKIINEKRTKDTTLMTPLYSILREDGEFYTIHKSIMGRYITEYKIGV